MGVDQTVTFLTKDEQYMQEAIQLAQHASDHEEVPVGAVVVHENTIIGKGWNQPISTNDPTAHAEIIALRDAAKTIGNYRLLNTTLYVTLEPCIMCVGAMIHARIKKLVYAASDPKTGAAGSVFNLHKDPKHNHTIEAQGGVLADESAKLLRAFFRKRRMK